MFNIILREYSIFMVIFYAFIWVRVTRSLVLCQCFVDPCLSFVLFLLAIVLSVLLRYTDSDYLPLVFSNSFYGQMKNEITILWEQFQYQISKL